MYAQRFTEAELKQLLAFYQSPVGKKALVEEPKVLDQAMAYAGTWGDNSVPGSHRRYARADEESAAMICNATKQDG